MRVALGLSYRGQAYQGWQSQPGGRTVQDRLEQALSAFADRPLRTLCAGRTDAGVHALNQVVHLDCDVVRAPFSWVRGTNRFLPDDIAVQWAQPVDERFHARNSAIGRRYVNVLRESRVRPSLLIGEHDFSAFRSAECQAASPVKTVRAIGIHRRGAYWRFEFDASAFLHHMVRNIMGCLVAVGSGQRPVGWLAEVIAGRDRTIAAPTFAAAGLYFAGPYYDPAWAIPAATDAADWLP